MSKRNPTNQKRKVAIYLSGTTILSLALIVSVLIHVASFVNLSLIAQKFVTPLVTPPTQGVKVRIVEKPKAPAAEKPDSEKKVVEVAQEETTPPKEADYKSFQDHSTDKQTKTRQLVEQNRAADAGTPGKKQDPKQTQMSSASQAAEISKPITPKLEIAPGEGLKVSNKERVERYKSLLPGKAELNQYVKDGYQQFIDDEIELGDSVDINTTNYRFMGYFSNMRKAIQLVWNYPLEAAQKGMQGEVQVYFVINKNGEISRIKLLQSSGYKILDDALVEALRLASPFAPLPDNLGKDRLSVTGSFRYILSSFLAGTH